MADEIDVKVSFDVVIDFTDGSSVNGVALFHEFGAPKGTLIFHEFDFFGGMLEELQKLGYTCSQFGHPESSWYDPGSLLETLLEWGRWE